MGLAASQARLLTITARKADCEFESMKLSHQKIALSRDMERISDEYQDAMNKTKLVYDYYGTGTSQMALTYGLLMTPSIYNDYYPKLVTDKANRIVLSGAYAYAAKAAGIPVEGYNGTPSSEVRNKFIEALSDKGVISAASAANVESVSYNNAVGLGATYSATETTTEVSYNDLLEMIKANCADTSEYGLSFSYYYEGSNGYPNEGLLSRSDSSHAFRLCQDGYNNIIYNINLYDLLNDTYQYQIAMETGHHSASPIGELIFIQQLLVGTEESPSFLNWLTDQFSTVLGGTTENDLALQYAYNQVYDLLYPDENAQNLAPALIERDYTHDGSFSFDTFKDWLNAYNNNYFRYATIMLTDGNSNELTEASNSYIGPVYNADTSDSYMKAYCGFRKDLAVNLNNICDVFLTAYKEYQDGVSNSSYSYGTGQTGMYNLYKPSSVDTFKVKADTQVDMGENDLEAGFYDALFNKICSSGWTQNDNIVDLEYLQELMKSGAVFISTIGNDGLYYQTSYSTDTYISEVTDSEGIAQAESKYNAAKAKIEHKENTVDMKMKNLDTEISSLTTEYDTMKSVISKTIEKSFKRYDA